MNYYGGPRRFLHPVVWKGRNLGYGSSMPWVRIRSGKMRSFVSTLSAARIERIVAYCADRKWVGLRGFEECSAYRWRGIERLPIEKDVLERAEALLPSLIECISPDKPLDLILFVNAVVASALQSSDMTKASRRQTSKAALQKSVRRIESLLDEINTEIGRHWQLSYAFHDAYADIREPLQYFSIISPIDVFRWTAELLAEDISHDGGPGRYISRAPAESRPKLNSVEKARYLSWRFNGPKFVTTPGSDFSHFAGLIHEIATGQRNESMQGAIIRVAQGERPSVYAGLPEETPDGDSAAHDSDWAAKFHLHRAKLAADIIPKKSRSAEEEIALLKLAEAHLDEAGREVSRLQAIKRAGLPEDGAATRRSRKHVPPGPGPLSMASAVLLERAVAQKVRKTES